jgi:hypothetical protein
MTNLVLRDRIVSALQPESNEGDAVSETGALLIGHLPDVAPKAYQHVVFPPLLESEIASLEKRMIPKQLLPQFAELLMNMNGLSVFLGQLRVFGYEPIIRQAAATVHNYPPNIIIPNKPGIVRGLSAKSLIIGFYEADGSYVSIDRNGKLVRFDALRDGRTQDTWESIDSWLTSEIQRLRAVGK